MRFDLIETNNETGPDADEKTARTASYARQERLAARDRGHHPGAEGA